MKNNFRYFLLTIITNNSCRTFKITFWLEISFCHVCDTLNEFFLNVIFMNARRKTENERRDIIFIIEINN